MYRGDGAAVIELGTARPAWQLLGDGAALALVQQVDGASELAARCVAALRERAWIGDAELADQLDGLTGAGSAPLLRPLAVDLDELAEIMDGDPATAGGAVDRETGTVWPQTVIDDGEVPDAPDVERFLWVGADHGTGTRTWSSSSTLAPTSGSPNDWVVRSAARAPSVASPICSTGATRTS